MLLHQIKWLWRKLLFHQINCKLLFFSHQATAEGIAASSDQPFGEQNVAPLELKHQKKNVASSNMKIRILMYQAIYVD